MYIFLRTKQGLFVELPWLLVSQSKYIIDFIQPENTPQMTEYIHGLQTCHPKTGDRWQVAQRMSRTDRYGQQKGASVPVPRGNMLRKLQVTGKWGLSLIYSVIILAAAAPYLLANLC